MTCARCGTTKGEAVPLRVFDRGRYGRWAGKGTVEHKTPVTVIASNHYPVDRNGKRYDIADGEIVLLRDAQSTNSVSYETNPVEVTGKSGRGFFNIEDLKIIY